MGPIAIFDKSFIESLSKEEAMFFDGFFLSNIAPVFYVETLADLHKKKKKGKVQRSGEDIVKEVVEKTPVISSSPNVFHQRIVVGDLMGQEVQISPHRIIVSGGEYYRRSDGKVGISYKEFPEAAALDRWKRGKYTEVEREVAGEWRRLLTLASYDDVIELAKNEVRLGVSFSSIEEVRDYVEEAIGAKHNQFIYFALNMLGVPERFQKKIRKRWSSTRQSVIPFNDFAPYAAHVLKILWFFYLCVEKGFLHLSHKGKPTNIIDLSYLFYLPFTMVFISSDKYHKIIAPLFIDKEQIFIDGKELKKGLAQLADFYKTLPKEIIENRGMINLTTNHPPFLETPISKIYDQLLGITWRKSAEDFWGKVSEPLPSNPELIKQLKKESEVRQVIDARDVSSSDDAASMVFKKMVPRQRAGWNMLPRGAEEQ